LYALVDVSAAVESGVAAPASGRRRQARAPSRPACGKPDVGALRFEDYFGVVPANSAVLLEKVFQLRHAVYCEELAYEQPRASHLERDEFDARSLHCLLLHKSAQTYAGCVRLVLADAERPDAPFPFERVCGDSLDWDFGAGPRAERKHYGEISRLAITANFRRRRSEPGEGDEACGSVDTVAQDERRLFPSVALGLYLAITAMGLSQGLDGVFAMMEPRLARQLRRFGIDFQQVGAAVDHRGLRAPYFLSRAQLFSQLKPDCRKLLHSIRQGLELPPERVPQA
jgi:N-acyl amino acid synthase of PEP-CTERM/exosortase system